MRLNIYNRKTGKLEKVLSERASHIVGDALASILELGHEEQLDAVVAIFNGYIAIIKKRGAGIY